MASSMLPLLPTDHQTSYGNGHVYETNLFCPVFYEGELLFWTMDRPHYMDMGASEPSTVHIFARDVYQERIHLPPFRVSQLIEEEWPGLPYSLSHQVQPVLREFMRILASVAMTEPKRTERKDEDP